MSKQDTPWNLPDRTIERAQEADREIRISDFALAPSGAIVLTGVLLGDFTVWTVRPDGIRKDLRSISYSRGSLGGAGPVGLRSVAKSAVFQPDGKMLVVGSYELIDPSKDAKTRGLLLRRMIGEAPLG